MTFIALLDPHLHGADPVGKCRDERSNHSADGCTERATD